MTSYGPDKARTGAQNARWLSRVDNTSREAGRSTFRYALPGDAVSRSRSDVTGTGRATYPRRSHKAGLPWLLDKIGQGLFFLIQFAGAILFFGGVFAVVYLVAALNDVHYPEPLDCYDNLAGAEYECSRIELPRLENEE